MGRLIFCFVTCGVVFSSLVSSLPIENEVDIDDGSDDMPDLSYMEERIFQSPNPETGKLLLTWNETSEVNPEELGEYAEGDIVFPKKSRNGLIARTARWPNGVIPYEIKGYFDQNGLNNIQKAMSIYHKYTCVSFRKRTSTDTDYISIISTNTGCWSSVGRIGGRQELNLQSPSCTTKVGTPLHELMHAAGFLHEQNRYERDDFVTIVFDNIKKGHENNFNKAEEAKTSAYGVKYDYRSVMHYSKSAFSVNGRPTIVAKDPAKADKMGQRDGFSKGDITKLNAMYNCPEKTSEVTNQNKPPNGDVNTNPPNETTDGNPLVDAANGILGWFFHKK